MYYIVIKQSRHIFAIPKIAKLFDTIIYKNSTVFLVYETEKISYDR